MKLLSRSCCGARLAETVTVAALTLLPLSGWAESRPDAPDKSIYNLLNPTPEDAMRELSPDRPDKTESPYTVDAGHFQLEMDFLNFSSRKRASDSMEAWNVAPFNLKAGLLNNVDLQVFFESYIYERTKEGRSVTKRSGVGDLTTRLKINLWGNDGGKTAFAVMPFVKWPTHTNGLGDRGIEGGLILPLAVELPAGWGMGFMTEVDVLRNSVNYGYHALFVNSITFNHAIVGDLAGYVEFFSAISTERGQDWVGTVDAGITYLVSKNVQLDAGINIGVTRAADDFAPFMGITWRF